MSYRPTGHQRSAQYKAKMSDVFHDALRLFIRGRETAMFYDHLVHAAYVQYFSFLLLFVFILLGQFTSIPWLIFAYTLILLIYLPKSARCMSKRGRFKSILTAYGVGSIYTLIMFFIGVFIVLRALQGIAFEISEGQTAASPSLTAEQPISHPHNPRPQQTTQGLSLRSRRAVTEPPQGYSRCGGDSCLHNRPIFE